MTIFHIVCLEFSPSHSETEIQSVCQRMLSLKEDCVGKESGKRYIVDIKGGRNHSEELFKASYTHGFIVEFENAEDLKYYLEEDPAHSAFVQIVKTMLKGAGVVDFTPGRF